MNVQEAIENLVMSSLVESTSLFSQETRDRVLAHIDETHHWEHGDGDRVLCVTCDVVVLETPEQEVGRRVAQGLLSEDQILSVWAGMEWTKAAVEVLEEMQ